MEIKIGESIEGLDCKRSGSSFYLTTPEISALFKVMSDPLQIEGQLTGFKNMKTTGGWRLEIDLFESKLEDILQVAALVNGQAVVEITLEPVDEKA